jgi:hypothetical protein
MIVEIPKGRLKRAVINGLLVEQARISGLPASWIGFAGRRGWQASLIEVLDGNATVHRFRIPVRITKPMLNEYLLRIAGLPPRR